MDNWETPPEIWEPLNREFHFDFDAAASDDNAKTRYYFTATSDALSQPWTFRRIWLNPPYGKMIAPFILKAAQESKPGRIIVALIPFRCRADWWHRAVIEKADEVRCIRKRVSFMRPDGTRGNFTGSCDSCLVIWRGCGGPPIMTSFEQE